MGDELEETEMEKLVKLGSYEGKVKLLMDDGGGGESISESESAAEETMLLWGIQQPTLSKPNAFVAQSSLNLHIDACGHSLNILQSPSSLVGYLISYSILFEYSILPCSQLHIRSQYHTASLSAENVVTQLFITSPFWHYSDTVLKKEVK
ncbi:hypothetical protein Pint_16604 [Pistacia integerrima]|uniref:Uncharacterized protein n=1 Tax=Pistacia integerrima TaxID=434235 RepID=A0ACC0ZE48_9ROSI|nr:hypothetical protein Pint_16604 [Pistacia integerrima]